MPQLEWKGTRAGQVQTGVLTAASKEAVMVQLRRQRIEPTVVKEKGKEIAVPKFGGKVPPQLVAIFTRQFSVMIDDGLTLEQCLEFLSAQQEHIIFIHRIIQIRQAADYCTTLA